MIINMHAKCFLIRPCFDPVQVIRITYRPISRYMMTLDILKYTTMIGALVPRHGKLISP